MFRDKNLTFEMCDFVSWINFENKIDLSKGSNLSKRSHFLENSNNYNKQFEFSKFKW